MTDAFPGFATGWYFPESLQSDPALPDPAPNAKIPDYEVYLESMRKGLASAENEANGSHNPETAPIDVIDLPELPPAISGLTDDQLKHHSQHLSF